MGRQKQVFRLEGEYWTIMFAGRTVRLRDAKGLEYLATLFRRPGQRVDVTELVASGRRFDGTTDTQRVNASPPRRKVAPGDTVLAREPAALAERARISVTKAMRAALVRIAAAHPELGEHLAATIRRGRYCTYKPDPRQAGCWET